ncbi:MAG TPA: MaoC/PaaZ C-terminal domain-containing protein [Desulfobacterales bacterium]|nr:MaoC/PaaZ C-terminal domain-containing protein [Desulfobacterales bacterium]
MVFNGKAYDEIMVDDTFGDALTVTETHIVLAAGMFGDFNPLHVNQSFGENSRFGGRILHGPFTSALISAPVGVFFAGTAIAYLEHACRFKLPVRAGETLTTTWTVTAKIDKPKIDGGIAVMTAVCHNQRKELVAEADGKIMLKNRRAV